MTEPLFAAGSAMWPTPAIGPGWQTSFAPSTPIPLAGPGVPAAHLLSPSAFASPHPVPTPNLGPATGAGFPTFDVTPTFAAQGPLIPPAYGGNILIGPPPVSIAATVPAVALIATVAVRRGQPLGPTNDQELEDFIYDALEMLPGTSELEVRSEGGRITLTGSVQHKRLKRDAGELAWAIPSVNDVQNNVNVNPRRRSRVSGREPESPSGQPSRKQS